jgi:hypothetical protein
MTGTLYKDQYTFIITSRLFLLRMKNVSDKLLEKIKAHLLCSVTYSRVLSFGAESVVFQVAIQKLKDQDI